MRIKVATGGDAPVSHELLVGNATFDGSGYYVKTPESSTAYVVSNGTIEPLKSWFTTPPIEQPTPTPLPLATPSATTAITGTLTVTSTEEITGSTTLTSTAPGAANPTTPLVSTPELSPTP
jgi:hypothetical protein